MIAATAAPRVRLRARLLTALLTLGCVVLAAAAIRTSEPGEFQVVRGSIGQPRPLNGGTVTVERVGVGTALAEDGRVTRTAGMFVVVRLTATAPGRRAIEVSESQLTSGHRVYRPYFGLASVHAEPGFRSAADLVFEVDPLHIADLTLELWQTEVIVGYPQHLRLSLGITAGNSGEWASRARGATVRVTRLDQVVAL